MRVGDDHSDSPPPPYDVLDLPAQSSLMETFVWYNRSWEIEGFGVVG